MWGTISISNLLIESGNVYTEGDGNVIDTFSMTGGSFTINQTFGSWAALHTVNRVSITAAGLRSRQMKRTAMLFTIIRARMKGNPGFISEAMQRLSSTKAMWGSRFLKKEAAYQMENRNCRRYGQDKFREYRPVYGCGRYYPERRQYRDNIRQYRSQSCEGERRFHGS